MSTSYWGFSISEDLYKQAQAAIAEVQTEAESVKHLNRLLAGLVHGFLNEGLEAYIYRPSAMISMSNGRRAAIEKGGKVIAGAIKVVIGQFFGSLDKKQLKAIAGYIDQLLWAKGSKPARLLVPLESDLYSNLRTQLAELCEGAQSGKESEALTASLQQVVGVCIGYYYEKPADLVGLKGFKRSATSFGISNVERGFDSFLGRLLSHVQGEELANLATYLKQLLHQPEAKSVA